MQARPQTPPIAALAREPESVPAPLPAGIEGALLHDGSFVDATPPAAAVDPDSDESLMRAFAAGDAAAFTRLYDRHERASWRFIRQRLGSAHEAAADDVLQETWISVAKAAPRYVATARFTTWLYTVARSRAIDYLRTQANAPLSLDDAADEDGDGLAERLPADAADGPQARVESRQQARAFMEALEQLPASQREAKSCPQESKTM